MRSYGFYRPLKRLVASDKPQDVTIKFGVFQGINRRMIPIDRMQVIYGLWERETYRYLSRALRARWMIDIGAGFGEMAVLFAQKSASSPIYAVEPEQSSYTELQHTLEINQIENDKIKIVTSFIGQADGCLPLDSFDVPEGEGFIKIDVDGAEMDVFKSGRSFLELRHPMILLETHTKKLEEECESFLKDLGYQTTIIKNAWYRAIFPEHRTIDHNRWMWAEYPNSKK
jgi:predicted RNA methylase